ncbi:MAG: flagellum-specific ATP synthase FliI, partial [Alphaproteobacteria bacterium]
MGVLAKMMVSRINRLAVERPMSVYGHVSRYDGQMIECNGFPANIGALCQVETDAGESAIAEVIGFHRGNNLLSLHDFGARIRVGARVTLFDDGAAIPVGDGLLGRVTDALGVPLDDGPPLQLDDRWPLMGKSLN